MKKIFSLILAICMCLSICACGEKTTHEVAKKLNGSQGVTQQSTLWESTFIYEFEYSGDNCGTCEFYNLADGEVLVHYTSGVYSVEDDEIIMEFYGSVDQNGNISRLESKRTLTLTYTYEDDELIIKDENQKLIKVK